MPMISAPQTQSSTNRSAIENKKTISSAMGETDIGRGGECDIAGVRRLLWGDNIKEDVFRRWSQGFRFSRAEPSALVQDEGGPCAAIAPIQAFLLKILLSETPGHCFQDLTAEKCDSLLVRAVCGCLAQCSAQSFKIAGLRRPRSGAASGAEEGEGGEDGEDGEEGEESERFHERLRVEELPSVREVERLYGEQPRVLTERYGVLLVLYSAILSKGTERVRRELADPSEPLIHGTYGYGSQGLINLMLTGRAVGHVWDHEQRAGGMRLSGIERQPDVGFITVMEHMRYCTVGSFYKNPKHPVWVMGSETHLTVLFSFEKKLASPETAGEAARRVFRSFDPDGNNFIQSALLQDLLCAVDLVSDPDYVDIMRKKLDSENLGIILLNAFMEEFFCGQRRSTPDTFALFHYNGLARSNAGGAVAYRAGEAVRPEGELRAACEDPMLACLRTKWPGLEVSWSGGEPPSLN